MKSVRILPPLLLLLLASGAWAQDPREALAACQESCSQSCFELVRTLQLQLGRFQQTCGSAPREESSSAAACIRAARDSVSLNSETVTRLCADARPGSAECIRAAKEHVSGNPDTILSLCSNAAPASASCIRAAKQHVSSKSDVIIRLCANPRPDAAECIRAAKNDVSSQPESIIRLCAGY